MSAALPELSVGIIILPSDAPYELKLAVAQEFHSALTTVKFGSDE